MERILEAIKKNGRVYNLDRIEQAYAFAKAAHEGQLRQSGEPYINHPVAVAEILIDYGMDTSTIVAALLHDVVEDTGCTLEEIKKKFSPEIAMLVDGVTKLTQLSITTKEEMQAENIRKMLLAMSDDIRVVVIKLADRLHNMRTLEYKEDLKRREKALETMEVYAPIAHRLGIRGIKEELEDRSLFYLDPVGYNEIVEELSSRKEQRESFLKQIKERIEKRLDGDIKEAYIEGRVKSIYGIYRKTFINGRSFDEVYDIYALRIIVDTVIECYNVLGIIHDMFRPIPNRFKDYISTPKPNMYQSLHTTVISKEGIPFEIQIRTWDMHHTAEYGIASHWKYKAGVKSNEKFSERLAWIRNILETQKDSEDVEDILKSIKSDLLPEEVFVFTPKGDVISMPSGSTIIDFAYAIHTQVGHKMIGAKVDGRMTNLSHMVKTGEIVEIITQEGHAPNRAWIKMAKTSEARNKIRGWFKKERREENVAEGREELEREFRRNNIQTTTEQGKDFLELLIKRQRFENEDDFYAAIGYGGIILSKIMPRIRDDYQKYIKSLEPVDIKSAVTKETKKHTPSGVIVDGIENCLVKFSRCCNPLPGDDIVGFVTRGFGVSVHKKDCVNVAAVMRDEEQKDRLVGVHWAMEHRESFKATLEIIGFDRNGLLADVTMQLSNMKVPIHAINARQSKDMKGVINITIGTNDLEQLQTIITRLYKIEGIISIERFNG